MPINIEKVKELMLENGLNQKDLADKAEMSPCRISEILSGKTSTSRIKTVHSIAKALDVKPKELLLKDGETNE